MKAIEIIVKYDDGTIYGAFGDDADKIMKWYNDSATFCHVHNYDYNGPVMKELPKNYMDDKGKVTHTP